MVYLNVHCLTKFIVIKNYLHNAMEFQISHLTASLSIIKQQIKICLKNYEGSNKSITFYFHILHYLLAFLPPLKSRYLSP